MRLAAEGGGDLLDHAQVDGPLRAGRPAGGPGVDRLGEGVGELRGGEPGEDAGGGQGGGERVDGGGDAVPAGERCQLAAGELAGEVGDQQRLRGQDRGAVDCEQRLPAAQGAAVDVGAPPGGAGAGPLRHLAEAGQFGLHVLPGPLPPPGLRRLVRPGGVGVAGQEQPGQAPGRPGCPGGGHRERQPGQRARVRPVGRVPHEVPQRVEHEGQRQERAGDPSQREPPGPLRPLEAGRELGGERLGVGLGLGVGGDGLAAVAEDPAEPGAAGEQQALGPGGLVVEAGGLHRHDGVVPLSVVVTSPGRVPRGVDDATS